jgi:hypothetical protein
MKTSGAIEASKDPPLERTFQIRELKDGNAYIACIRRGELAKWFVKWSGGQLACNSSNAKTRLELAAESLRMELAKGGFPTDRDYIWIRKEEGDWRPDNDPDRYTDERPYELRSWHDQLIAVTEPLTRARIQGDVLDFIDQIQRQNFTNSTLWLVLQFADAWGQLQIAGELNNLAIDGAARKKALLKGGKARAKAGAKKLELVCKHTDDFWREKPAMRGNRGGTADWISVAVNEELRAAGERTLSTKRIADLITRGIGEKLLHIG